MAVERKRSSILFLCDYQAPYGGNFIASMMRLDDALHARGVQTTYLFPAGAGARMWCDAMRARGKRVQLLPEGGMHTRLKRLLRAIDASGANILHVHFGFFPLAGLAALLRPRLRLILHFHSDFSGGRSPTPAQRMKALCKRVPELFIGSRLQKITVSEGSARTTGDCIALRNALAEERFAANTPGRGETRAALHVRDGETLLLVFGWSPWIKGVDVAAQAVAAVRGDGHTQFLLGIVCGRDYPQERMQNFLQERAGCTGNEPWLRFLPPVEDVFCYHKAADVMVSASRSETFSYALLEAVCMQRPCVCSDIPGVRWAAAFDTVSFFPTENAAALAHALLEVEAKRRMDAYSVRLEESARRARRDYALDDWVNGMLEIYGV